MYKTIIAVVPLLILLSAAVAQPQQAMTSITGQIVDANTGAPIAGRATVFMNHDGSLMTDTAVAGENGVFKLMVPAKPDRMLVWAENYAPKSINSASMTGTIVTLAPLETLTAQLVDWNGVPVANAPVYVRYGDADAHLPDWMISGLEEQQFTTDANGVFIVNGVIPNVQVFVQTEYLGASYRGDPQRPERWSVPTRSTQKEPIKLVLGRLTP